MTPSRRHFIGTTALGSLVASALAGTEAPMPKRTLGRTSAQVSILAFGCGSRFLQYKEGEGIAALNHALDLGVTYVDTAYGYGDGLSETRVGKVIATRRAQVWLTTKVQDRSADGAMRILEGSLKRLQTDHLDLIHIHSLSERSDLAKIEALDGVLKLLYKLRDQKVTRAIGITSHTDPAVLKMALERNDFDCTQMALNAARAGMAPPTGGFGMTKLAHGFETIALPVAVRKNMGIIAMKVFAQEGLVGAASPEQLLRYSLSLPVTAAVVGMPKIEFVDTNIGIAKAFRPMPAAEMKELSDRLAVDHKARLDRYFYRHVDCSVSDEQCGREFIGWTMRARRAEIHPEAPVELLPPSQAAIAEESATPNTCARRPNRFRSSRSAGAAPIPAESQCDQRSSR